MKCDLNCFDSNSIELCIFAGYISIFVLSPVFKNKALVCVLPSSIWVLYQGWIFLGPTEWKNITDLFCFKRAHFKVFVFLCFLSWRMQTFQRAQKVWRLNSQISQDGTFVYYPFFVLNILLFTLFTFSYLNFFYYLFVLTYVDSSRRHTHVTTHPTRMQYFAPKWRHLMRFFAGATSRALALLLAFAAGNIKNLTRRLCAHEKIWARLVGKSVFDSKLRSLQRLIKESLAVCNLLFVYAVTL